jgi:hypothetical protein
LLHQRPGSALARQPIVGWDSVVPGASPQKAAGVIPVRVLNAFFQEFAGPSLQQIVRQAEVRWRLNYLDIDPSGALSLAQFSVRDKLVYIFSDVEFYATTPSAYLGAPEERLDMFMLNGNIRFDLSIGGRSPLDMSGTVVDGALLPSAANTNATSKSGWDALSARFGVQHGFALYAGPNQVCKAIATVDKEPRFVLSRLGVLWFGFSMPATLFEQAFAQL